MSTLLFVGVFALGPVLMLVPVLLLMVFARDRDSAEQARS